MKDQIHIGIRHQATPSFAMGSAPRDARAPCPTRVWYLVTPEKILRSPFTEDTTSLQHCVTHMHLV